MTTGLQGELLKHYSTDASEEGKSVLYLSVYMPPNCSSPLTVVVQSVVFSIHIVVDHRWTAHWPHLFHEEIY